MKRKEFMGGEPTVMKHIAKVLKPTLLTAIVLLLMLLTQVVFCSSTTYSVTATAAKKSASNPATATDSNSSRATSVTKPRSDIIRENTRSSYGMGAPVRVTHNGATTVDINWFILSMNLVFSYLFASLVSLMLTEATRFRCPALVYGSVTVFVIAATFCVAIGMSKWYWGYFLSRPAVLKEISEVTAVSAVIPVQTESDEAGNRKIVVQEDYRLADCLAHGREDPYYCLSERILLALEEKQLLPSGSTKDLSRWPDLFPLIRATGILATPEKGYNDSDLLHGIVVDAVDKSGRRLVFLGLQGMQLSNDHFPYYEMVFSGRPGMPEMSYVRGQRFFYDWAGIEGLEWFGIWLLLSVPGIAMGFVAVTIGTLIWRGAQATNDDP